MSDIATIVEIKHKLNGARLEFECQTLVQQPNEVVVLYRTPRDYQVADQCFKAGSLSLGYFWDHRNFNIYHWLKPNGDSMGIYVNIADRTTITAELVEWRDLILDLLITPDGRCQLLDEDELPADLPPALHILIYDEVRALQHNHQQLLQKIEQRSEQLLQRHNHLLG